VLGAEYDLGVKVGRIDLTHELATSSTGRQHVKSPLVVTPYSSDPGDPVLPGGHHGSDRGVLSTEARAGRCVDANANVPLSRNGVQSSGYITEQSVSGSMRPQNGLRGVNQVERHQSRLNPPLSGAAAAQRGHAPRPARNAGY
jgi:hypothetical protein